MSYQSKLYEILTQLRTNGSSDVVEKQAQCQLKCEISFAECIIDEEWLCRIEQGMSFVGKAIDEERRFIRVNGEVVPIEKVKRVSKESIRHLARHSELITNRQTDDIVPDKLYTVERLNDYATYENRFLYRLLATVKEFLSKRRSAIAKAMGSYNGSLRAHYKLESAENNLSFDLTLDNSRSDDEYMTHSNGAFERLDNVARTVDFYLSTPLMTELAKEASIQATITKNNVLKMDKNFKEAVDLYDFLLSYGQEGYKITEKTICPDLSMDMNRIVELVAFTLYGNAPSIADRLSKELKDETANELELLKEQGGSDGKDYMSELERRSVRLSEAEKQTESLLFREREQRVKCEQIETRLAESERKREDDRKRYEELIADYSRRLTESQTLIEELREQYKQLEQRSALELTTLKAQLNALTGKSDEDVSFEELERRYELLGRLVNGEWRSTKKELRRHARKQLREQLFGKDKTE